MPSNNYTNPGSYSWTAPFATKNVTARVVGGGASGYRDCDGDDEGGGGGGGGFSVSTRNFSGGQTLSITVGSGGSSPSCDSGNNGGTSQINGGPGNIINVRATGGQTGTDDSGGGGGGSGSAGDSVRSGGSGADDDDGQDGGGAGNSGGNSGRCGNGRGGRGTTPTGATGSCPGGRSGASYGAGGAGNDGGSAGSGAGGCGSITWEYHSPTINTYTVGNNYNEDGIPDDTVEIVWNTSYADDVKINKGIGSVSSSGTRNESTGLQSNANGTSPAEKDYTITVKGPGGTVTRTRTAKVKNDNTPSNGWSTSFINLEPSTQVVVSIGTLAGVDMPTTISTTSGNFIGLNGSFSSTRNFNNGETVQLRTTSMPFNTTVPASGNTGFTNSKTVPVTTPSGTFNVTFTTRAPVVGETFNYANNTNKYPYEDIDLITNSPTENLTSAQIGMDDIEIPVEIKVSDGNVEVSINGTPWQNVRSI